MLLQIQSPLRALSVRANRSHPAQAFGTARKKRLRRARKAGNLDSARKAGWSADIPFVSQYEMREARAREEAEWDNRFRSP